jgi:hypothetical protein
MKLTTVALAFAFALSSTFALAYTTHHKHSTHHGATSQGTVGMGSGAYGRAGAANGTVGTPSGGWYGQRGGLVGGSDNGVDRPTR